MLMELEGVRGELYNDVAGLPTIGVGHLLTKSELASGKISIDREMVRYREGLSNEQIDKLFKQDISAYEKAVTRYVIPFLTQQQFDALVSFAFNVGIGAFRRSTLVRLVNKVQYDDVPAQLRRWIYSAGKTWDGLVARREVEIKRWLA